MKMKQEERHIIFTLIINPTTNITITWNMINGGVVYKVYEACQPAG